MARTLTAAQLAARDERRARFATLAHQIGALTDDQRAALAATMPVVTIEGRTLSLHNACLVALQCPAGTVVGGFQQWKVAGRQVRKGEHGLMIWAPRMSKDEATGESERAGFIPITVFDVSQTDEIAAAVAA